MLERMLSKGNTFFLLVEVQTYTPTMEINMEVLQKIVNLSTSRLSLCIYPKDALSYHKVSQLLSCAQGDIIHNSHKLETT